MQSGLIVPQSKHLLEILAVFAPQWAVQQLNRLLFGAVPREHTVDVPPSSQAGRGGAGLRGRLASSGASECATHFVGIPGPMRSLPQFLHAEVQPLRVARPWKGAGSGAHATKTCRRAQGGKRASTGRRRQRKGRP